MAASIHSGTQDSGLIFSAQEMTLLSTPQRLPDEGQMGYRFRLANANLLSSRELVELQLSEEEESFAFADAGLMDNSSSEVASTHECRNAGGISPWVTRWARFCPGCLAARGTWHVAWEILFADACATCGTWLIDTCSECGMRLSWHRQGLLHCGCGDLLISQSASSAPRAVAQLSAVLAAIAMGREIVEVGPAGSLTLSQLVRLIRLLGSYGASDGQRSPQKMRAIDRLETSWPIVCAAAEILCTWPNGFFMLLDRLKSLSPENSRGKLVGAFGGFYLALYKGFSHAAFDFLRRAFEDYVAANWTGAFARRNTRLAASVLDELSWIPASRAQGTLGVSRARLNALVADGKVKGELRLSAKGRKFLVVNKADVSAIQPLVHNVLSLEEAARGLGLKKTRLQVMLPIICPEARQRGDRGSRWDIPSSWMERWNQLLEALSPVAGSSCDNVSLRQVLRYWPWTDEQLARLFADVQAGRMIPIGRSLDQYDIGGLQFEKTQLRDWFSCAVHGRAGELTIPQTAFQLDVKQEVAYALVRLGLLETSVRQVGRRTERCVSTASLEQFRQLYVFGRDLARQLGRSPKAVAALLASHDISPVAGPSLNSCRQLLFQRTALGAYLPFLENSS
jgi:hypothetical protein